MNDALSEPLERVSPFFQVMYSLASASAFLAVLPVLTILIPAQVAQLDEARTAANLAIVLPVGAAGAFLGNPLGGALSDRTTSRFGRRRPWILLGSLAASLGLALLAISHSILWLSVGWFMVQFFGNVLMAAYNAILPDRVPVRQRGTTQAILGLTSPLLMIVGAYYLGQVQDFRAGYYPLILVLLFFSLIFISLFREAPLPAGSLPNFQIKEFTASFWIRPRQQKEYAWAWVTWLLIWTGYALGTSGFLYLYLQNVVGYEMLFPGHAVKEGISYIQILQTGCSVPLIMLAGTLSDRLQRRKIFIVSGVSLVAAGLVMLVVFSQWTMVLIASILIGVGFSVFYSLGLAMISQILPSAASRGKDLGVMNVASVIPQMVIPGIGAAVLGLFAIRSPSGYQIIFSTGIGFLFLGLVLLRRIRSVR